MAVQGEAELQARLAKIVSRSATVQNSVLDEVAEKFAEKLEGNIKQGTPPPNVKNHIPIKTSVSVGKARLRQGTRQISVGIEGSSSTGPMPAWRAHFADTGSIHNAPQFFSERTRGEMSPVILTDISDAFRKVFEES